MPRRIVLMLVFLLLAAVSCRADEEPVPMTRGPGADDAVAAAAMVHDAVQTGEFDVAAALTVQKHAALASLAEGATFADVAVALTEDDLGIASNFWSGFAQAAGESFLGEVDLEDSGTSEVEGLTYHLVTVSSSEADDRRLVTQGIDGHRIDLFASFGAGLAERMISPVQILLTSATDDAILILSELRAIAPSLEIAAADPNLTPEEAQMVLQLIELITRIS